MGSGAPAGPRSRVLTVLFSDVEGYTARSGIESREGLVELVRRHRQLAEPLVRRRGGRIIKAMGDGLLAGFDGATDAVLAATQIQEQAARNNRDAFTDRQKLYLRIGISTGEVTVEQDDVYGQAVNLASRAQQVAPAGGVLFTAATLAMLNRAEVRFADAGLFSLKGFDEPVPLYKPLVPAATPDGGANGE